MPSRSLPDSHPDLLERPLFAHLATVRPDGSAQSNGMWFAWDGDLVRFTHTSIRQKYRNLTREPRVALSVHDPDAPYRFRVRCEAASIYPDEGGAFYKGLQERYGYPLAKGTRPAPGLSLPMTDVDVRVVVAVWPTSFVAVEGGSVVEPGPGGAS